MRFYSSRATVVRTLKLRSLIIIAHNLCAEARKLSKAFDNRKERACPLWKETVAALKAYLEKRGSRLDDATPLFVNREGNRLTRFGVRYIIAHRVAKAADTCPSLLTRRVTPHTIRHTTAMHLLQSNVDLNMIRSWLGHASIATTNGYVEIDLEMERKTLRSSERLIPAKAKRGCTWRDDDKLLSWLAKL